MNNPIGQANIRQILSEVCAPLMLSDGTGNAVFANHAWEALRDILAVHEAKITQTIRRTASSAERTSLQAEGFRMTVTPVGEDLYLCQVTSEDPSGLWEKLASTTQITSSYQKKLSSFGSQNYIATSDSMIRIFTKAKQVAAYPTSILLLGDTGVGKEVIASFIHHNSDRADKPFIKINCSAIPDALMESELFGYESGAFTGARDKGKAGLFELANHGTILLDEIGDMPLALQAKLLRVIQENEVRRVGGSKAIPLDVRIISATSRDLEDMMEQGAFLDALFYRLNVVEIQIPALQDRREDILPLAEYYLQFFCEKYKLTHTLSPAARECFLQYKWPGNVRELRNTMENLAVSAHNREIDTDDLPARMAAGKHEKPQQDIAAIPHGGNMKDAVEALQREMIIEAVHTSGSLRKAAAALEMDPATLHRLVKKLQIEI